MKGFRIAALLFFVFSQCGFLACAKNGLCAGKLVREPSSIAGSIHVARDKAVEFRSKEKILRVAIGNPKIADVAVLGTTLVRLVGVGEGTTNLLVTYQGGGHEEYEVVVGKRFKVEVITGIVTEPRFSLADWQTFEDR